MLAQDFQVKRYGVDAMGRFQVRHAGDTNSYYILLRGSEPGRVNVPASQALGVDGDVEVTDPLPVEGSSAGFYRIQRVSRGAPLDSDGDGLDDVYELTRPTVLNPLDASDAARDSDGDGYTNLQEARNGTDPSRADEPRVTTVTSSPAPGESGVSVNRETIVRFSSPLSAGAVLTPDTYYATFGGRRILSRIELSADRRSAFLFYLEPLPGSARIEVMLDATRVLDASGRAVDADGDGRPGGVGRLIFETVNTAPVSQTAVIGRVFASEPVADPLNPGAFVNRPLEGVEITVDGMEETLRTRTDAAGNFRLEPVPAGRFFVHVDGRTAVGSTWPGGAYYPFVGKAWEAVSGISTNLAGGTGEIFLPRIAPGTLQAVSSTQATSITFPPAVVEANPALAGVQVDVPANALVSENGVRGGRVGIAPVAPDRLPEPLPPGLDLPLVITVQTDGPGNFDRPVPVRFPNLADPRTGRRLAPGAKSALWSFNHDTGRWEIQGPMTVTADGNFVESDAGVGIRQPGWHGSAPGTAPSNRPPPAPCGLSSDGKSECGISVATGIFDCLTSFIPVVGTARCLAVNGILGGVATARDCGVGLGGSSPGMDCAASAAGNAAGIAASCLVRSIPGFGSIVACGNAALNIGLKCVPPCAIGLGSNGDRGARPAGPSPVPAEVARWQAVMQYVEATIQLMQVTTGQSRWADCVPLGSGDARRAALDASTVLQALLGAASAGSPGGSTITPAERDALLAMPRPPLLTVQVILDSVAYMNQTGVEYAAGRYTHAAAGRSDFMDRGQFLAALDRLEAALKSMLAEGVDELGLGAETERYSAYLREGYAGSGKALDPRGIFFLLTDETNGLVTRGRLEAGGNLPLAALQPNAIFSLALYHPGLRLHGRIHFLSAEAGSITRIPESLLLPQGPDAPDADVDGLPDEVERVVGTDPVRPDSDGDGLIDGVEVQQGTEPLDGRPVRAGILASAPTPGPAVDIAAWNDLALVATGGAGVSVFNIFNGLAPTLVSQLRPSGNAIRVAFDGGLGAVALEDAGLGVLDLTAAGGPRISRQVPLGSAALSVAVAGNLAFVGLASADVAVVEMVTGAVLQRVRLEGPVRDVALGGDTLLALTDGTLHTLSLDAGELTRRGAVASPFPAAPNRRLFATPAQAYAVHGKGYNAFDITNASAPRLLAAGNTAQFGWKQVVLNGSGLGLAATSPVMAFEDPATHNVSLYNTRDPMQTDRFVSTFVTPGFAQAVSIYNGLAYVADGAQGIQVVNYLAFDALGKPPTIQLRTAFATDVAEEGKLSRLVADVSDDVQVRNVEFYVDGVKVGTDGNYPFEHRFVTPTRTAAKGSFTIRAVASDTGGNRTTSDLLTIHLVSDATPPSIRRLIPSDGSGMADARRVGIFLSEPVDPSSITADAFFVLAPGPDGAFGTPDDAKLAGGRVRTDQAVNGVYLEFPGAFPVGTYQLVVRGLRDLAGNHLGAESRSLFTSGSGLTGEYFDNIDFTLPVLTRVDPRVDFDWGVGTPDPAVGPDQFSVRWRGSVVPPVTGSYTFYTLSDDGVRLWVDGELVIQKWTDQGTAENASKPVELVGGRRHDIQLEMYENWGRAVARLLWSGPDVAKQVVPASHLLPYEDQAGPRLLAALPDPSFSQVTLRFSEPLDPGSAETPSNYALGGGVSVTRATLQPNRTDVVLATSRQQHATRYEVTVRGVRDASDQGNPVDTATRLDFTTLAIAPGALRRDVFYNIPGSLVSELTASERFPHPPDDTGLVTSFEAPSGVTDSYGQRLSGWVIPPVAGDYVFYIASDDQGQLFLSTDDSPANKRLIASEPEWNRSRDWIGTNRRNPAAPENRSGPVRLEANRRYYIEALHKEMFGGDGLGVTWQFLGDGSQMFIEAEDVDFGGGQSVAGNATGMQGPYLGGAYAGLGTAADAGIDWNTTGGNAGQAYRPGTGIAAGKLNQHPDGRSRGDFTVEANYIVGWNDAGDWYNYSRRFPTPSRGYAVFGRLSSGASHIGLQLDQVASGVGTPKQSLRKLGQFRPGRSTGGWDTFELFPLLDDAGNPVAVELGGDTTLRLTTLPNSTADIDYLVFLPASLVDMSPAYLRQPVNGSEPIPGRYLATHYAPDGRGQIHRDVYRNIPGARLSDLVTSPRYPDLPDEQSYPRQLEAPRNVADAYGQRLSGYLLPPVTGEYTFYLASDDEGVFLLSTDETPSNLRPVASEPTWSYARAWSSFFQRNPEAPENRSQPILLEAGRRYYFEALHKEIHGSDHLGVTWRMPGERTPADGAAPIPGMYLATLPSAGPTAFVRMPADATVDEEGTVTLTARVQGVPPFSYRWLRDGEPIPGANSFSYTTPKAAFGDDQARFVVEARGISGVATSTPAVVTVVPDRTPPRLIRADADRLDRVVLTFSEALDPASASDSSKYVLDGGLAVAGVAVLADATRVAVATSPQAPGASYTVRVTGMTDDAHFRNPVAPGSEAAFKAPVIVPGGLQREAFRNIVGSRVADLVGHARFPLLPDEVGTVGLFETPGSFDDYGVRLSGYITPPVSGDYLFYLASDDNGELWLSTDENPANKSLIATEPVWNPARYWVGTDRRNPSAPENVSAPIPLVGGRRYYVEALMKESWGLDALGVTWQLAASLAGAFFVEAEDFNTGGGRHPLATDTMPYAGGALAGLPARAGVDYHDPGFAENDAYRRPATTPLLGNASANQGEVQLTPNTWSQLGAMILAPSEVAGPLLDVSFDLYVGGGSGADGFSFNFGDLAGNAFGEQGAGSGLRVQFDTWNNSSVDGFDDEANTIEVWHANTRIAKAANVTLRTASFVPVRIQHDGTGLTVTHNGVVIFENLEVPGWNPQPGWRLGWGARTGVATDRHIIRRLEVGNPPTTIPPLDDPGVGIYPEVADLARPGGNPALAKDWAVGWLEPGDWMNYTRTFPPGEYYAFARAASATGPILATLGLVDDAGSNLQVVTPLGSFFQRSASGGWSSYVLVPMTDASGQWVKVSLGGENTLRFTMGNGALNLNYLMLVPVSSVQVPPPGVHGPLPPANGSAPIDGSFLSRYAPAP